MERKYKITIPEPCTESWEKMTLNENGRFCLNCSKTVVDFTSMLSHEVQHFFTQNQNNRICGRFKDEQLETLTIQVPCQVLNRQTNYHKMFLLALFIAMGTTLFSCHDKDGNKQKIDKVEIVDDNPKSSATLGMIVVPDDHQIKDKDIEKVIDYDDIFNPVNLDVVPVPKNGIEKFYAFVNNNYVIPNKKEKYTGKIYISFVIEKDGSLSTFKILRDAGTGTGEEAIRVLKMAPKWIPGKLNNHLVRTSYNLPISFKQ